ncbi:MAG TPA: glycoside hydrolase family 9 protein [Firmicutes bacterium]|nr:glycoside hydrolase family 9 protein [Bacillota bacterium]
MEHKIYINQIGYKIGYPKTASVIGNADTFSVIDMATDDVVYTAALSDPVQDESSGDSVRTADFSLLEKEGRYCLQVGPISSDSFVIQARPYTALKNGLIKALYFQRCGVALDKSCAGKYTHGTCHNRPAVYIEDPSLLVDVSGGWHDAGDYGRYTVAAATALGHILYAYELFPQGFQESLQIPESGNGIPDILNECRFELEWILKMQAPDGSAYHKVATRYFCGMIMPEYDTGELLLFKPSLCATGAFAAVTALGARIYQDWDPVFAERLQKAAEKAWTFIESDPPFEPFTNPPDVNSGGYGDRCQLDEYFWAACELFRLTGQPAYRERASMLSEQIDTTAFGWSNVGGFGGLTWLIHTKFGSDPLSSALKQNFLQAAEKQIRTVKDSGYHTALTPEEYRWGSNMTLMNHAIQLIVAYLISGSSLYANAALEQLHYLVGKNPMDISYVTGYGVRPYKHPHHRPSEADRIKEPVPGMVSGGPNRWRNDDAARTFIPEGTPPAKSYIDHPLSHSTNEITIYWNSPAIFVAAFFDAEF